MANLITVAAEGGGGGGGDLFADMRVLLRDLDPSNGGGNGEALLDVNGQVIPIGLDPATGATFPIYFTEVAEGDFEIPPDQLPFVQEISLGRANVARAPASVMEDALDEALGKIAGGTAITTDAAGRIMVDGVTIDSPRENLALYQFIMTEGGSNSWTDVLANASTNMPPAIANLLASGWDPTGLLGAAFSKSEPILMDAVLYEHSILGVNEVTGSGDTLQIDYISFTDGVTETYDYDRVARYGDIWLQWFQDMDGDPFTLEAVQRTALDAVWGSDGDGDGVNDVGSGVNWTDEYVQLSVDGLSLETVSATTAGVNDWAQAVDDARAVILMIHDSVGGTEVPAPARNIVSSGDFNADGTDDIALRDTATGTIANWQMSDNAVEQQFVLGRAGLDWTVTGTGDFNGDGTDDILFRNQNSGWVLNWQMSDGTVQASVDVAGAGLDWDLVGIGDFNGDGTDDIVLRHQTSGWLLDWTMSDGVPSSEDFVGGAGLDWDVAGVGDFNGDGTDDILLRHTSGAILNWEMSNGALSREISVANAGADWAIAGIGDYNGDGTDDVLFQNSGTSLGGVARVWEMSDGALAASVPIVSPTSDWMLVG